MLRRLATAALTATVATSLPACTPDNPEPPPLTPSTTPTSSTSSPSIAPEQAAAAAAQTAYRRYIAAKDATQASGGQNVAELPKVATGIILKSELNQAATFRGRKLRGVGQVEVVWTKALKSGASGANGPVTEVTVQACLDSSKATAVDATGKSVKKPGTATRWLDEMQMRFVEGAWKAYYGMNEAATC